ncbi:protein phosphatase 1 regulatory subunit 37-like [Branchiostoma floridae]|uniref:Protein phosphatase 1 regulatory subunit 37 n=1 Tax=Branchiostoma floridae TaxID=7739 RepID=A0A9J7MZJ6_BRAFL|nr:protein phosphatase 1 regulatory subunit 37-like [Branchiostoma floridae]
MVPEGERFEGSEMSGPVTMESSGQPEVESRPASFLKTKLPGRRVNFPADDALVAGSAEPPDPWSLAATCTTEELLSAYRDHCQKLGIRPLPRVLQQLEAITDFTKRVECLNLKGERLDSKIAETLEEVLRRVRFVNIDLEQTSMDAECAVALADMIEYYESAVKLNIAFNKHISIRGWQAMARVIRKTQCLEYLDARSTLITEQTAPHLSRALRMGSRIQTLHLESTNLSGRPMFLLMSALKVNVAVKELFLADNRLGVPDAQQIGQMLKLNNTVQLLDLRNNQIQDTGLVHICEGLGEQERGIVTLVLWSNHITQIGAEYLRETLPVLNFLETLNMGHNPIGNEGVLSMKEGLLMNQSLLRLGLVDTKMTCEGAIALAEFLSINPRIVRLDLRENDIKTAGLMALQLAHKVNHSLTRLDLDKEPKKESMKDYAETQKQLLSAIQGFSKRNKERAREDRKAEQQEEVEVAQEAQEEGPVVDQSANQSAESRHHEMLTLGEDINSDVVTENSQAGTETVDHGMQDNKPQQRVDTESDGETKTNSNTENTSSNLQQGDSVSIATKEVSTAWTDSSPVSILRAKTQVPNDHLVPSIDSGNLLPSSTNTPGDTSPMRTSPDEVALPTGVEATIPNRVDNANCETQISSQVPASGDAVNNNFSGVSLPNGSLTDFEAALISEPRKITETNPQDIPADGDANINTSELSSSPDDFEKELDQILANVTAGKGLDPLPGDGVNLESLDDIFEEELTA